MHQLRLLDRFHSGEVEKMIPPRLSHEVLGLMTEAIIRLFQTERSKGHGLDTKQQDHS